MTPIERFARAVADALAAGATAEQILAAIQSAGVRLVLTLAVLIATSICIGLGIVFVESQRRGD